MLRLYRGRGNKTQEVAWKPLARAMRLGDYAMFIRFREQGRRLQASLTHTRRVAGKMQSERFAFWAKLPERLARLGNRFGPDDHPKIYGALHARIPMVMPDEQRAVQEENARDGERLWSAIRDL